MPRGRTLQQEFLYHSEILDEPLPTFLASSRVEEVQ